MAGREGGRMRIGDAVAALGVEEPDDGELCVVIPDGRRMVHYTLGEVASEEIGERTVYLAGGVFRPGSISRSGGRTRSNLRRILRVGFDIDLATYLNVPKDELYGYSDEDLDASLSDLRADVEETFGALGIPIHQLDMTGYGYCAYLWVDERISGEVEAISDAYRRLVARINAHAGYDLADPQVSDAGTRITRLTPCVNLKGGRVRDSVTLYRREGVATIVALLPAGTVDEPRRPTRVIPDHGRTLADADAAEIVTALRPHWQASRRHQLALGLGGWFAKAGLPEHQALAIVAAISDGDEEAWDRQRAVRTSYERVRGGHDVRGYHTVRELVDDPTTEFVDGILERLTASRVIVSPERQRRVQSTPRRAGEPQPLDPADWPPLPELCLHGPIGEYVRLTSNTTEASDTLLLAGWLSLLAATVGRQVAVEYAEDLYPNLFVALVGDTGFSRKDHAVSLAINTAYHRMRKEAGTAVLRPGQDRTLTALPFGLVSDISSAQGLVKDLGEVSTNLLVRLREMSTLLDNMHRQSTTTIADKCIELFDCPPDTSNNSKKDGRVVIEPCLNIVATTQPARLAEKMTNAEVVSGFGNRWLYLFGTDKGPKPDPPRADKDALGNLWAEFRGNVASHAGSVFVLAPEAKTRWNEWYDTSYAEARADKIGGPMRIRHHPIARKLALLYAIADGSAGDIGLEHLNAGIALVDWSWSILQYEVRGWGAGDEIQLERRIETVLTQKGRMKKHALQAQCKRNSWPQTMFHRVVDAMVKNRTLQRDAEDWVWLTADEEALEQEGQ